ncbi:prepilin peptidase [Dysosmobacter sp.]|uniref:prepilin peptidase n=1 Tax=Dysosmobacter sp. TaxID=2591382 RepID=UPI00406DB283
MSAAWTDLRHRQIYDLSSIIIAGAGLISFSPAHLLGLLLSVPFLLASNRGRGGMGDALLIAASGFLLGVLRGGAGLVLALLLYCLFYLAVAIEWALRGAERPPESYPLAPFLAVGFITAYII